MRAGLTFQQATFRAVEEHNLKLVEQFRALQTPVGMPPAPDRGGVRSVGVDEPKPAVPTAAPLTDEAILARAAARPAVPGRRPAAPCGTPTPDQFWGAMGLTDPAAIPGIDPATQLPDGSPRPFGPARANFDRRKPKQGPARATFARRRRGARDGITSVAAPSGKPMGMGQFDAIAAARRFADRTTPAGFGLPGDDGRADRLRRIGMERAAQMETQQAARNAQHRADPGLAQAVHGVQQNQAATVAQVATDARDIAMLKANNQRVAEQLQRSADLRKR